MSTRISVQMNRTPAQAPANVRSRFLQRQCACGTHTGGGGDCKTCGNRRLQRGSRTESTVVEIPPAVHDVLRSPGNPLDPETRAFMEPRFGHDFSHVRVHTDVKASQSARAVDALAYTAGRDVVFQAGQYAPHTAPGRKLLAHELTHVVQQSSVVSAPQLMSHVSQPTDAAESEAGDIARAVVNGPQSLVAPRISAAPAVIYREKQKPPWNGQVVNNSSKAVTVWNDQDDLYAIAPGTQSDRTNDDVDHVRDENGQWYKVGPLIVTVEAEGNIHGYLCWVNGYGQDCPGRLSYVTEPPTPDLPKPDRPLTPPVSTNVAPRHGPLTK